MKPSITSLVVCALACWTLSASAQVEKSLYGLQLRSTFDLKECPLQPKIVAVPGKILSWDEKYAFRPATSQPCFQHRWYEAAANPELEKNAVVRVLWPSNGYPAISRYNSGSVLVLDGQIHRVWFWTRGLEFQKDDITQLIAKFGKPANVEYKKLQNGFGATFESLLSTWDLGDSAAWFESYTDNINTGMLVLETFEGAEAYKARLNARKPVGPKM